MANNEEFAEFWSHYPKRVGKLAAAKAYERARKVASAEVILTGVAAYASHLPEQARFVLHPATFLNQGRWSDEYAAAEKSRAWGTSKKTENNEGALRRFIARGDEGGES